MPPEPNEEGKLSICQKLCYGVGHFLNDICASMWFTYLLIYFHRVINFSNGTAGNLMLLGQVSDGLCTPFIGYESDRTKGIRKYGKRKTWHLVGTFCVACTFPFLFNQCIECSQAADWAKFFYYAPFVVIFQFGWASTQISHLALIPHLTPNEHDRVELNAIRYSFTVIANLVVFGITWLMLDIHNTSSNLSVADAPKFRDIVFIVVGIGILFSIIFHVGTKETDRDNDEDKTIDETSKLSSSSSSAAFRVTMRWTDWFKEPQFYMIGLLYMCTRLIVNVSQVYLPMYLEDSLGLTKQYIAIVPLIVYLSGFVTTFLMKLVNKLLGKKPTFFCGLLFVAGSCVWNWFICVDHLQYQVIGAAICLGIGGTTVLVTSLSMTADLIAMSLESSAFVYGAMSFTDKISNGVAVMIIQQLHPCLHCCVHCEYYYRNVMVFVVGGVVVLAIIGLVIIAPQKIGVRSDRIGSRLRNVLPPDDERAPLLHGDLSSDSNRTLQSCAGPNNTGVIQADVHHVQTIVA